LLVILLKENIIYYTKIEINKMLFNINLHIMSNNNNETNGGAVQFEIENLLETMKQKDMRRYEDCLFSVYGSTKIYVSIREFVWTHIVHPCLAEATCTAFQETLTESDKNITVTINVTDFCLPYPQRPIKVGIVVNLSDDFELLCDRVVYRDEIDVEEVKNRSVVHVVRWKHPEDTKTMTEISSAYVGTLGDLGFTDGTKVYLVPEMKLKQN
jgi:hypothetical protein